MRRLAVARPRVGRRERSPALRIGTRPERHQAGDERLELEVHEREQVSHSPHGKPSGVVSVDKLGLPFTNPTMAHHEPPRRSRRDPAA